MFERIKDDARVLSYGTLYYFLAQGYDASTKKL
jgi:hypothetical protein